MAEEKYDTMDRASNRIKTKVVTFRLPIELVEHLEREAKAKKVNMNTHVTQALSSHVELHSPAFAAGMFPFPRGLVRSMLEKLDDKTVGELGRQMAQNDFVDLAYMNNGHNNSESFINTLLVWARHSGFPIQDVITDDGNNTRNIIIKHEMGEKWSLFMSKCLQAYFDQLKVKLVEFEIPNDMLVMKIRNWEK